MESKSDFYKDFYNDKKSVIYDPWQSVNRKKVLAAMEQYRSLSVGEGKEEKNLKK